MRTQIKGAKTNNLNKNGSNDFSQKVTEDNDNANMDNLGSPGA